MKRYSSFHLILLVVLYLINDSSQVLVLTDRELEILSNVDFNSLPFEMRTFIMNNLNVPAPNKNCCLIGDLYDIVSYTRLESRYLVGTLSVKYYADCGLWGWDTCGRYRTEYRLEMAYYQNVLYEKKPKPCPSNQKTCCKGYMPITSEHCITLEQATANSDLVIAILNGYGK